MAPPAMSWAAVMTARCPWFPAMLPSTSTGPLDPPVVRELLPPQPVIVIVAPPSKARAEATVNSRRPVSMRRLMIPLLARPRRVVVVLLLGKSRAVRGSSTCGAFRPSGDYSTGNGLPTVKGREIAVTLRQTCHQNVSIEARSLDDGRRSSDGVPKRVRQPVDVPPGDEPGPGCHSRTPPESQATTGTPKVSASSPTIPKGSCQRDGKTRARARR